MALVWYLGSLIMIHISVIRLANHASGLVDEMSQEVALDESQAITNGLDEGVVILDEDDQKVIYTNEAAQAFQVKT